VIDEARPTSVGEEEMQLQIALALSREEAQREEEARKGTLAQQALMSNNNLHKSEQ
jgi:epsin